VAFDSNENQETNLPGRPTRHRRLHLPPQARAGQVRPTTNNTTGPQVSRNSLLSELANLTGRNTRLAGQVARLEQRKLDHLEQQVAELRDQLAEREEDLQASRATNRQLMTHLNGTPHRPR